MTDDSARRLARGGFVVVSVLYLAGVIGSALLRTAAPPDWGLGATFGIDPFAAATFAFPLVGVLIAARQPRNRIGWILLAIGLAWGLQLVHDIYIRAAVAEPGSLPGLDVALALSAPSWIPGIVPIGTFLLLFFPDGRLPSPRWRPVIYLTLLAMALPAVVITLTPGPFDELGHPGVTNPLGVEPLRSVLSTLVFSIVLIPVAIAACAASLVVRYRRSRGIDRLRLKWLTSAAAVVAVLYLSAIAVSAPFGFVGGGIPTWVAAVQQVALLSFVLIPVAIGIGILKYRLFDIELVINKAVVYGALAMFITAVYIGIVVGVGSLVGAGDEPSLALSIVATALVALAFQPVRERVQRFANRIVYGHRTSPYEVLSTFASQVGGSYAIDDVLPRMARVVAEGTGAARAEVWLAAGGELRPAAAWPADASAAPREPVPIEDDAPGAIPASDRTVAVRHRGELLGAMSIAKPPGEPMLPAEASLLEHLASQAGLLVRNARLAADLRTRLDQLSRQAAELQESRSRIVEAGDAERRRLERDIHDGAQQNLVALAVKLRLARTLAGKDPERALGLVEDLRRDTAAASEILAALARGIYPPLLSEGGLVPALQAHARGLPFAVEVEAHGVGRYDEAVEAAVYFSILEALQNAAKYADASRVDLVLRESAGSLEFTVRDDGRGFDAARAEAGSGTRNMADRLEGVGGSVRIDSSPGRGTTVEGHVPATAMAAAG